MANSYYCACGANISTPTGSCADCKRAAQRQTRDQQQANRDRLYGKK